MNTARRMTPNSQVPHPNTVEDALATAEAVLANRGEYTMGEVLAASQIVATLYAAWKCS